MKHLIFLYALLGGFGACRSGELEKRPDFLESKETVSNIEIIPGQRVGLVTAQSTEAGLREAYGPENMAMRSIQIAEGWRQEGVVLFPGTKNEAEIVWDLEAANGHPAFVRIGREGTDWRTTEGISIGTPIWRLQQINGGPFELNGFAGNQAGLVLNWQGGLLNENLIVVLIPTDSGYLDPALAGENLKLLSNDARLTALKLQVGVMVITFD